MQIMQLCNFQRCPTYIGGTLFIAQLEILWLVGMSGNVVKQETISTRGFPFQYLPSGKQPNLLFFDQDETAKCQ